MKRRAIVVSVPKTDLVFTDLLCSVQTAEQAQAYLDSWADCAKSEMPDSDPGDHWRFRDYPDPSFGPRGESISLDRNPEMVVRAYPGPSPLVTLVPRTHTDKA